MMHLPRRQWLTDLKPISGVLIAVLLFRTGSMVLPFYAAYLTSHQHLTASLAASIVGVFGFGALLADGTITGVLSLLAPTRAIALAMLGQCLSLAIAATTVNYFTLIAVTIFWGFCYEVVNPTSFAVVTRTVPEENQRIAFSAVRLCINIGMGIGPAVGSVIYVSAPELLFAINASLGLAAAAALLASSRTLRSMTDRSDRDHARWHGSVRDEARIWSFLLTVLPVHLAYGLPATVASLYIVTGLHLPAYVAGAIFAVNAALIVAFELPINLYMKSWRNSNAIALGSVFAAIGFTWMGLAHDIISIICATVIWTIGEMIIAPAFLSYVKEISPRGLETRNVGLFTADINVGVLLAPIAYTLLRNGSFPGGVWTLTGGLLLLTALVIKTTGRRSPSSRAHDASSSVTVQGERNNIGSSGLGM